MKKAVILGTRPEIIKLYSIIQQLDEKDILIHTNQHYSKNMDQIFFDELMLPLPKYNLHVGSGSHATQMAKMLQGIESVLLQEKPDIVIVQGDTNSVLAGALTASKLNIEVAHVEAGLRSGDRRMPEEINRIVTDHVSRFLFTPTNIATKQLFSEGIETDKIFEVGNTIIDTTTIFSNQADNSYQDREFALLTIHRAENVEDKDRLVWLFSELNRVAKKIEIIFPVHPKTKSAIKKYHICLDNRIKIKDPVSYLDFLNLQKNATVILTDSGGIQEEAFILKIPCITLRTSTERTETVDAGANMLMSDNLLRDIEVMTSKKIRSGTPYGSNVGKKILDILERV